MSYSAPARPTDHNARRRRRLLGLALFLALLATALAGSHDGPTRLIGQHSDGTAIDWPQQGQAAFVLGDGIPAASPGQHPAPIASLAKLMTAYVTLERYPLSGRQEGFATTITTGEAQAEAAEAAQGASVVAVRAGEQLTERQLLEALLIPSGNNIAQTLGTVEAGGEPQFLAEMNAEARELGMNDTLYTDPSGFDRGTVSTAADQLRVLRAAMRFPVFRQIVSMRSVTLPVVGIVKSFNPLVAKGYAGKTGSDSAAGGCLAFFAHVRSGGRVLSIAGVVMGQGEGSDTAAILTAAGEAAEQLVDSVVVARRSGGSPATDSNR